MAALAYYYVGALCSVPLLHVIGDVPCGNDDKDGNRRAKFGNMQIVVHALLWPVGVPLFVWVIRPRLCEWQQRRRAEEENKERVRVRRAAWDSSMARGAAMKRK